MMQWIKCGVLGVVALMAACGESSGPTAQSGNGAVVIPAALFLDAAPGEALDVKAAKSAAKAGDKVVVRGRIGGSETPFVDGRAMVTIVDPSIKSCDQMGEDDHCPTPWDYCCEPHDNLTAGSATIQIVGADGRPLKASLKGQHGLEPLAEVVVVGTVALRDEAGTFVVNATSVWVKPKG